MNGEYEIGTTKSVRNTEGTATRLFVWINCPDCGYERWVVLSWLSGHNTGICQSCSLTKNGHSPAWKGGRNMGGGKNSPYVMVWVSIRDFFYPMASVCNSSMGGYIREHRLVMAKHLGRCLQSWEIVHHKNNIPTDNRIENLQLVSDLGHKQLTLMEGKLRKLQEENRRLKLQLRKQIVSLS